MVEAPLQHPRKCPERHPGPAAEPHLRGQRAVPLRAGGVPRSHRRHGPDARRRRRAARLAGTQPAARDEPPGPAGPDAARTPAGWRPRQQDAVPMVGPEPWQGQDRGRLPQWRGRRRGSPLRRAHAGQLGALGHPREVDQGPVRVGALSPATRPAESAPSNGVKALASDHVYVRAATREVDDGRPSRYSTRYTTVATIAPAKKLRSPSCGLFAGTAPNQSGREKNVGGWAQNGVVAMIPASIAMNPFQFAQPV